MLAGWRASDDVDLMGCRPFVLALRPATGKSRLQAWHRKIEKGAQLEGQKSLTGVDKANRHWGRLKRLQHRGERSSPKGRCDLVGQHARKTKTSDGRIDGCLGSIDDKSPIDRDVRFAGSEGDPELTAKLMPKNYKALPEQVILFRVSAWDTNCPQHIPQRFEAAEVAIALAVRDKRIEGLEAELARLAGRDRNLRDSSES
jgi:hypothetical protein